MVQEPAALAPDGLNQLRLTARWVDRAALRYTPAGMPALDLTLEHQGVAMEAGHPRRISLKLHAVALGDLAQKLPQLAADDLFLWTGFLAAGRNGRGVVFHLLSVEPVAV